jgi:hypothetical protein
MMKRTTFLTLIGLFLVIGLGVAGWLAAHALEEGQDFSNPPVQVAMSGMKPKPAGTESGAAYRFVAIGDWGAGTQFQKDVAHQMWCAYQKEPFEAALLLGDNIYENGNVKKLGKAFFNDTYTPLIESGVHFLAALGNHDYKGGFQADQVRFFGMPSYYYQISKPERVGSVAFFALDTNQFARSEVQQRWLNKALSESTAPWKVVFGHHPIYSSGEHGNNRDLQKALEPILIKHHVDLYLAGHDHEYERFAPIKGVQHIVSGGGGAYLRDFNRPVGGSLVRKKAHHFLNFELDGQTLRLQVIDKTGQVIDSAQWQKQVRKPAPKQAS